MLFERIKLEGDEKVIATIRKHWWIIAVRVISVATFALTPLILAYLVTHSAGAATAIGGSITKLFATYSLELWYLYLVWLLVLLMSLANFWTDYYLDLWAITNRRVILVDQRGFFRRFISSFRLERLQDMNIEVDGFLATILDYGSIEAQTASPGDEEFKSHHMPNPRAIKAMIVEAADELTKTQSAHIQNLKEQGL